MTEIEIRFTDFVDQTVCTRRMEAGDEAVCGLVLFREKYAKNPAQVMAPEDEQSLLAAFCEIHDAITDHIIERCMADDGYCRRLTDDACDAMTKLQGMDWHELGDSKRKAFDAARADGTLEQHRQDFAAFVQFMLRPSRPVPSLFQDLITFKALS